MLQFCKAVAQRPIPKKEISISYGNKGNEELLYLYGFVIDNNPDDYLMVIFTSINSSLPFQPVMYYRSLENDDEKHNFQDQGDARQFCSHICCYV